MIAIATTGTTDGRKKIVRNSPTARSRRLSRTARPSAPATLSGTAIAAYASVRRSAPQASLSSSSST